jgi:hypothetical protein
MKKEKKKLKLVRENLLRLEKISLEHVVGGRSGDCATSFVDQCETSHHIGC